MRNHPELKALLADFTQFLLLRKPADAVDFAAEFFSGAAPLSSSCSVNISFRHVIILQSDPLITSSVVTTFRL